MVCAKPQLTGPCACGDDPSKSIIIDSPFTITFILILTGSLPKPSSSNYPSAKYSPSLILLTASLSSFSVCLKISSLADLTNSSPKRSSIL